MQKLLLLTVTKNTYNSRVPGLTRGVKTQRSCHHVADTVMQRTENSVGAVLCIPHEKRLFPTDFSVLGRV